MGSQPNTRSLQDLINECAEDSARWFPEVADDLNFMGLAICGETGEMANLLKKVWRGSADMKETLPEIEDELVDVLTYTLMIAGVLNMNLEEAYSRKRRFNELRFNKSNVAFGD